MNTSALTRTYLGMAAIALSCASLFTVLSDIAFLPVLGTYPLLPTTVIAALSGYPLLNVILRVGIRPTAERDFNLLDFAVLVGLGALLAVPPIAIDLIWGFPHDMNVPVPQALLFYPAIGFVAEVVFHLLPLAILVACLRRWVSPNWLLVPVIFVEPLFQMAFSAELDLQAFLVFGNVCLVSAVQIWLFRRFGFGAMIALRMVFYLFWHVLWGTVRLSLLFPNA